MITLNGQWKLKQAKEKEWHRGTVPGTVYTDLLTQGLIVDPYVGENEDEVRDLSYNDYLYEREFLISKEVLNNERNLLICKGIDTIADLFVNGKQIGSCDNMHREYEFDLTGFLKEGVNHIQVYFHSPMKYMQKLYEKKPLWGVTSTVPGYQYIRKAHCMFGWDWGPKLPDMGIWRDIYIEEVNGARIQNVQIRQQNEEELSHLSVILKNVVMPSDAAGIIAECRVYDPEGKELVIQTADVEEMQTFQIEIKNPERWWPNGYGEQKLYRVCVSLKRENQIIQEKSIRLGIRDFTVVRRPDEWGAGFTFCINGMEIFAKGANYIPEDSIFGKRSKERTERLLKDCRKANFNCIRVWGGGCYPDDYFYDLCDELGLLVWQDFMFACAVYDLTDSFYENIKLEARDNIIRLRNHPSLGMWCGNNEMEGAWVGWGIPQNQKLKQDYLTMFERLIPQMVEEYDPDRFYWPASPSSEGGFEDPFDEGRGDAHYWDVWHGKNPFEDIESKFFRFSSEYGFEAIPSMKTLRTVIHEDQLNIVSPEMEKHQKCIDNGPGNVTLMYYLLQYYQLPTTFERTIYVTQSLQSDFLEMAIRHFRSHRERCSGSTYWQINDTYPTISWATLDYYGRWKGAHYVVKRSYGKVISYVETGADRVARLYVSSDETRSLKITCRLELIEQGKEALHTECREVTAEPLTSTCVASFKIPEMKELRSRECYLHYEIQCEGEAIDSGNRLLERPKKFHFLDPHLTVCVEDQVIVGEGRGKIEGRICEINTEEKTDDKTGDVRKLTAKQFKITVKAQQFARRVGIEFVDTDVILSDNYFDLLPGETKTVWIEEIRSGKEVNQKILSEEIVLTSNYDVAK